MLCQAIENGGRFEDSTVEQLKRLGGWADKSGIVHLYIKRIVEEFSDTSGMIIPGKYKRQFDFFVSTSDISFNRKFT